MTCFWTSPTKSCKFLASLGLFTASAGRMRRDSTLWLLMGNIVCVFFTKDPILNAVSGLLLALLYVFWHNLDRPPVLAGFGFTMKPNLGGCWAFWLGNGTVRGEFLELLLLLASTACLVALFGVRCFLYYFPNDFDPPPPPPLTELQIRQAVRPCNSSQSSCAICLDPLSTDVGALPCQHKFHIGCVREWLVRRATCPECRKCVGSWPWPPRCFL